MLCLEEGRQVMNAPVINIKNVKVNKALSEETICFSGELLVNGISIPISNRGNGGAHMYGAYSPEQRSALKIAEDVAAAMPAIYLSEYDMLLPMDLDLLISMRIGG